MTEDKKDVWWDSRILKTGSILISFLMPGIVWVILSITNLQSDVKLVQQRQEVIQEIKTDITEMKKDLVNIRVDVSTIKRNQTP